MENLNQGKERKCATTNYLSIYPSTADQRQQPPFQPISEPKTSTTTTSTRVKVSLGNDSDQKIKKIYQKKSFIFLHQNENNKNNG